MNYVKEDFMSEIKVPQLDNYIQDFKIKLNKKKLVLNCRKFLNKFDLFLGEYYAYPISFFYFSFLFEVKSFT